MNGNGNRLETALQFDVEAEIERICHFIRREVERRGVRGVVIGLSGGLDSSTCAYLCKRCLPAGQIHLYNLPERDSSASTQDLATKVAQALNLPLEEVDVSGLIGQLNIYDQVPHELTENRPLLERAIRILGRLAGRPTLYLWAQEYAFGARRGFFAWVMRHWLWIYAGTTKKFIFGKIRARMLILSAKAMAMDCLLICTTDRSEWSVGFYDPHGDGVGDIAPLRHLYKTQIQALARAAGVLDDILQQPSSADLAAGLPNETAIGLKYAELDQVLAGFSLQMPDEEIAAEAGLKRSLVMNIRMACRLANERREMPVSIPAPAQNQGCIRSRTSNRPIGGK